MILYLGRGRPLPLCATISSSMSSNIDSEENGRIRHDVAVCLITMKTPLYLGLSFMCVSTLGCVLSFKATRVPDGKSQCGAVNIFFLFSSSSKYLLLESNISAIVICAATMFLLNSSRFLYAYAALAKPKNEDCY